MKFKKDKHKRNDKSAWYKATAHQKSDYINMILKKENTSLDDFNPINQEELLKAYDVPSEQIKEIIAKSIYRVLGKEYADAYMEERLEIHRDFSVLRVKK